MRSGSVLIVGGAGYIGGHLTDCMVESGYDVTVYDNIMFESRYMKDNKFIFGDIRDKEKLKKIIKNKDAIVWLAGLVGDGACAVNTSLTNDLNVECLKWLVDNYDGKIIFPSTCSVYGINDDLLNEESIPNPLSLYASTKLEAERYVLNNAASPTVFRLGTLFGVGDSHSRIRLDLVVNILSLKATIGESLTVFGGDQWRPLLHVRDAAEAMIYALQNNISGLYNLSDKNMRIKDLAAEISGIIPGTSVNHIDMKFEDLRNYKVDNSKIKNMGWNPKYSLEFGIYQIKKVIETKRIKNIDDIVYSNAKYMNLVGDISWK